MAATVDVREQRGVIERGRIFERNEFHRLPRFRLDRFFRDQPAHHRDPLPDITMHLRRRYGPQSHDDFAVEG